MSEQTSSSRAAGERPATGKSAPRRLISIIAGGVLLLAGVAAVAFVDWNPLPPAPDPVVRPVKTAVAIDRAERPERRFNAEVSASRTVDLAFQVSGPLIEAELDLGRRVQAGDVLARIDPARFELEIETLRPKLQQAESRLERIERMVANNAATQAELIDARAARDAAAAQLDVAEQALEDATLRAPFEALVVARYVENFQNVRPAEPVVRLQDVSELDIVVNLPESLVANYDRDRDPVQPHVIFPVRPELRFPATVKEASAEADPQTGTYRVVYSVASPDGFTVLPGMAASLVIPVQAGGGEGGVLVPMAALFVDAQGGKRVWRLEPEADQGVFRTTSIAVATGEVLSPDVVVTDGLEPGDRVVTAGVAFVRDGQRVRLMEDSP